MQSITDLTHEQVYRQFIAPLNQGMIGREFRVDHLTSEKGRALNGRTCRVVGFTASIATNPDGRLQCAVEEEDGSFSKPILLKGDNLVQTEANIMRTLMAASDPLTDKDIIKGIKQGLSQHEGPSDRADLNHRITLYRKVLRKLEAAGGSSVGNALEDEEYCMPCGARPVVTDETPFDRVMRVGRPACVGNNTLDLRLMDLGLKGDGATECNICASAIESTETRLVTLPCVHMFHATCLEGWLSSDLGQRNWNCPTCRHAVPHDMSTYTIRYEAELRNRFQEFLLSGFCPKCILWVMERDRNQLLPGVNAEGHQLSMGENVGQMQDRVYVPAPNGE